MLAIVQVEAGLPVEERIGPAAKESPLLGEGYMIAGRYELYSGRKAGKAAADDDDSFHPKIPDQIRLRSNPP